MLNYSKINKYTGLIIGIFASIIYIITAEASGSFWDCGEFIACAAKLQNPHPPGNPFFVLVGRLFVILFGNNISNAAVAVNTLSAISGGATIMFLFWITTYFAKKIIFKSNAIQNENQLNQLHIFKIIAAGLIASLTFTFTDSFWFNAVEGEVYALSHFLLVLMFYLIIVWEGKADQKGSDKYLIIIALILGLAVGIHLLDLLVVPAIAMVFYYKKFKVTNKGALLAFLIGCVIVGFIMVGILQYSLVFAAKLDMFFVNSFDLPIFYGFFTFFLIFIATCIYILRHSIKKGKYYLQLSMWGVLMIMLGYSTYNVVLIRSQADVPIDMNSPEDPMSFLNYIQRLQYGDKPLLYGPVFTAGKEQGKSGEENQPRYEDGPSIYAKKKNEEGKWIYAESGKVTKVVYNDEDKMIFPRLWQTSDDRGSRDFYANWLGIQKLQDNTTKQEVYERAPTFLDNIKFFVGYQFGWMYLRYMMWNFIGRQSDIQGFGDSRDGNVISGINVIDKILTGADQSKIPDSIKNHESNNKLYAIPFILGLIGLFYHYKKDKNNFIVNLSFYFFTGIAIILYLNDTGPQPRERDYAHTISFLAFAVWIGIAILPISEFFNKYVKKESFSLLLTFILCFSAPILEASNEWNDHNRGNKTLAYDYARAMLSGCPQNSILFTFGDNDTYPLWFAQEIKGYRKDVRVVNTSLLGIDWYINQLRYKINQSDSLELIFNPNQIFGGKNDYLFINSPKEIDQSAYYNAYDVLKNFVATDDDRFKIPLQNGDKVNYLPTKKFSLELNQNQLITNGIVDTAYAKFIKKSLDFEINKNAIYKGDLMVLSILSSSINKRPICFTSEYKDLGFDNNLQKRGMIYQVVPYNTKEISSDLNINATANILNNLDLGKITKQRVYYDETNRQQMNQIRDAYADLALEYIKKNQFEDAKNILHKADSLIPNKNYPYAMVSRYNQHNRTSLGIMQAAFFAKDTVFGNYIYNLVKKDLQQQSAFYKSMSENQKSSIGYEFKLNEDLLKQIDEIKQIALTQFNLNPFVEKQPIINNKKQTKLKNKSQS